jgi:hypothetical protein
MKVEEALREEFAHWQDIRSRAVDVQASRECEMVLGALKAVAEKAGVTVDPVVTAKGEDFRLDQNVLSGLARTDLIMRNASDKE